MTNIKATYESITRRLNISSITSWSELETQFHTLFDIPQEVPIAVTYTDEEGDDITLSSDLELQEALSNPPNKTIKFVLKTPKEKNSRNNLNDVIYREGSIDTMMDEETLSLINGVSSIRIGESNHHNHKHVTIDDQETRGETSKKAADSTNNGHTQEENGDGEPEIIVIITRNLRHAQRFGGSNSYHPYHNFGRRFCHESPSRWSCNTGSRGCGRRRQRHQISPEIMTEKLNLLHSMGFFNDGLEELIKRYNGNLEQIVEVLLLNQREEQDDEKHKEKEVREENDKESMEVEENNVPYNL